MCEGTHFLFSVSLAILNLIQDELLALDFSEINEYFKQLKGEGEGDCAYTLLPDFEKIIQQAKKISITYNKIVEVLTELSRQKGVDLLAESPKKKPVLIR